MASESNESPPIRIPRDCSKWKLYQSFRKSHKKFLLAQIVVSPGAGMDDHPPFDSVLNPSTW